MLCFDDCGIFFSVLGVFLFGVGMLLLGVVSCSYRIWGRLIIDLCGLCNVEYVYIY